MMHVIRPVRSVFGMLAITVLFSALHLQVANAQSRLSDKDIENLMKNIKDDVKSFRPGFNSALSKSAIRKTSREKDAKNLVVGLEKNADTMLNEFKHTKKAEANVQSVIGNAEQIDDLVFSLHLDRQTTSKWERIRSELEQLSIAFGMPAPFSRDIGPLGSRKASGSIPCIQAVGSERSKRLIDQCLAVSPATHPPCNAQNSCELIIDEIKRSCNLLKRDAPGFCSEYTGSGVRR